MSRRTVDVVKRTRLAHRCQGCQEWIPKGRRALALIVEGYDVLENHWKRVSYFHNLAHLRMHDADPR